MRHTAVNFAARRHVLRAKVAAEGVDTLVVTRPANVAYLTGFTGSNGTVLVAAANDTSDALLTDRRYEGRTNTDSQIAVAFASVSTELTQRAGIIGVEADHVSWAYATSLTDALEGTHTKVVPTHGLVDTLRVRKDPDEIAALTTACAITVDTLNTLFATVRLEGMSEQAIAERVSTMFRALGADGDAFPAIVASGENGAVAHHEPTERIVARGDLLTIDCGARVNGYHADCTRTVAIGAKPSEQLVEIYTVVKAAQHAATQAITNGVRVDAVDSAARDIITDAGFGPHFVHGTGHGVGLEIHEAPLIGPNSAATLQPSVTCTSEPGIYLPGVGGVRIEDTVVVTEHGAPLILTDTTRDLLVV